MVNLSKISESLKELMEEHGLTQTTLSERLNTGRTKFSDILQGKSAPSYKTLIGIVEYFHCSADFLLGAGEYPREERDYKAVPPFQDRLRAVLQETGTSQYRFIKDTGISWSIFHGWLTGKTSPSVDNLIRIAKYFDCSVDSLLGRV